MQCDAVFRTLDKLEIQYRRADISVDTDARDYVMALGYLQAPVVYADPDNHHCGFRPDRLRQLAARAASRRDHHIKEPTMHQLTIDHKARPNSVSTHADFAEARQALLRYVVAADYYLRPVHNTASRTSYELLRLADPDDPTPSREPHVAAVATIEVIHETERDAGTPDFVACDPRNRITDHRPPSPPRNTSCPPTPTTTRSPHSSGTTH